MARAKEGQAQVMCYLEERVKSAFKVMCAKKGVTMSDWLASKVLEAVIEEGYYEEPDPNQYDSLAELAEAREEELLIAKIPKNVISKLKKGKPLEDKLFLLKIAIALGISAEDVMAIYEKSGFKEGATNGV